MTKIFWRLLAVCAAVSVLGACADREMTTAFTLRGDLRGLTHDTVEVRDVLSYKDTTYRVVQRDGRFAFVVEPDTFALYRVTVNGGAASFYAFGDKGRTVDASGRVDSAYVMLSGDVEANGRLMDFERVLAERLRAFADSVDCAGADGAALLDSVACAEAAAYVLAHHDDYVSAVVFEKYLWESRRPDYVMLDSVLGGMSGILLDLPELHRARAVVDRKKAAFPGRYVYLNNLEFTDGTRLPISESRGNYLFIEFWASWSRPSMALRGELEDVYAKFRNAKVREAGKSVGVNFIGVSLDTDAALCDSASRAAAVEWRQVCDGKAWVSDLVEKFAITSLPDNVLLGLNNKVIGRSLTPAELDSVLSARFDR